jgi:hypothetical protein
MNIATVVYVAEQCGFDLIEIRPNADGKTVVALARYEQCTKASDEVVLDIRFDNIDVRAFRDLLTRQGWDLRFGDTGFRAYKRVAGSLNIPERSLARQAVRSSVQGAFAGSTFMH